jgi:hypothetical protein
MTQLDDPSNVQLGNYRMPFFLTVTCLSTTNCPAPPGH